jgi:hypothetical protein
MAFLLRAQHKRSPVDVRDAVHTPYAKAAAECSASWKIL